MDGIICTFSDVFLPGISKGGGGGGGGGGGEVSQPGGSK